jgi:NAD(P)H-dependent FMN reductase
MAKIVGIAGSLRKASLNAALLRAARAVAPDVIDIASIRDIPLYDGDLEAERFPVPVEQLKQRLAGAAGLLLASPEYNHSVPGVLKNAIDWLSRPSGEVRNVFRDMPVAIMGASPGGFGTTLGQNAWLPVFHGLGARYWSGGRFLVSHAGDAFDEDLELTDDSLRERLERFTSGFIRHCGL